MRKNESGRQNVVLLFVTDRHLNGRMAPEILSATINAVKYRLNLSLILIGYYSASKPSILFHDIDTFIFYRR